MKNYMITITLAMFLSITTYAQTYDINKFIESVKANNKDILIAAKELELADAQKKEARSGAFPYIAAEAGYNRNLQEGYMYADMGALTGDPNAGATKFKITYDNEFSMQTVLSQQIFNYTVFNAIKASKQYESLTGYVYDATMQGVIAGSKKAFYQTLLAKEFWLVNKAAEKNAKENYDNIKRKYEQGIVSEFELLQAEVRWKNYIPETTKAKRNYDLALNTLKILAGIKVDNDFEISGSFDLVLTEPEDFTSEQILLQRPDYNALLSESDLRKTNIDVERSGHFPSLVANLVYRYTSVSNEFQFDNENNYLIAGLSLKVPIFSGWNVSAKVQKAEIEYARTQLKLEKAKEEICKEISNASLKIAEAKNRMESARTTLAAAQKAFSIAEVSAENDLATQLELKDTRIVYDQSQLNYCSAVYDYLAAQFDWELASGTVQ